MPKAKLHDERVRQRLIDAAGRILSDDGPSALSTRRITAEVGTSTTAIYSLFGSKEGLIRAIYGEGFRRLAARMAEVPHTDDALADLLELGRAYRANALANRHLYAVMFERPVQEFEPDDEDCMASFVALGGLVDAVARCVDDELLVGPAIETTLGLWAIVHGHTSLELAGMLGSVEDAAEAYERLLIATMQGYRRYN